MREYRQRGEENVKIYESLKLKNTLTLWTEMVVTEEQRWQEREEKVGFIGHPQNITCVFLAGIWSDHAHYILL